MLTTVFTKFKKYFLQNETVKQTIHKNVFWLTVCLGIDNLLKFFLLIYTARVLGVAQFGEFSFAFSFISIFIVFSDFGLAPIITREFAQEKTDVKHFYSIISLKLILSVLAFALTLLFSLFITHDQKIREVIFILSLFSLANGFIAIFYAFFGARQRIEYQAFLETFQGLLIVIFGLVVLFFVPSVIFLSYGYLAASLITLVCVLAFSHIKLFSLGISFDQKIWKHFLIMAWPLTLITLLTNIHTYADSVMLGHWGLLLENGWYNAAYRLVPVAMIPIALVSGSFYPAMSNAAQKTKETMQNIWDYQLEVAFLLVVPLVTGTIILAPKIIAFLYPETFLPAIPVLRLLIIMVGINSIALPFSDTLVVFNRQREIFFITLLSTFLNIALNLFLIPKISILGASLAALISHALILLLFLFVITQLTPITISYQKLLKLLSFVVVADVLMLLLLRVPEIYNLNVVFSIAIAVVSYFGVFFALVKWSSYLKIANPLTHVE